MFKGAFGLMLLHIKCGYLKGINMDEMTSHDVKPIFSSPEPKASEAARPNLFILHI